MFTHPDLIGFSVKQHMNELMAEAEHERVLTAALRRRRDARHAAREARHHVDEPVAASVKSTNVRAVSAGTPRDRFASPAPASSGGQGAAQAVSAGGVVSEADGNLSACEPPAAA